MENDEDSQNLEFLKLNAPNNFGSVLKNKKLVEWLRNKTPKLQDGNHTIATMAYWVVNGIEDFPPCEYSKKFSMCENGFDLKHHGNVRSFNKGYVGACCTRCKNMLKLRDKKTKSTCIERYGVDNFVKTDSYKKTYSKWLKENGVENAFQLESVKEKSNRTRKERYGYEFTMQSPEKRELASMNYKKKTGFKHQFYNPEVRNKIKESMSKIDSDAVGKKRLETLRRKFYESFLSCEVVPLFEVDEFIETPKNELSIKEFRWKCTKCGNEFVSTVNYNNNTRFGNPARCLVCHPLIVGGKSNEEKKFFNFVCRNSDNDVISSDRNTIHPYELDVSIPDKKLAFEFDGLFWHTESNKPMNYHLQKTKMCEDHGVQLIHIFEDEWLEKKDIVKSRVKNLLGKYDHVVYARNCDIAKIGRQASRDFQDKNHLQGSVNSKVSIGLKFDGELVSLMTFGKSRFNKRYEWELLRFCNLLGYHIPGAASKLLKWFEMKFKPKSLISYADRRWSNGKLYIALGFTKIHESVPGYFYTKNQKRFSRMMFQKHKLKDTLPLFDKRKSEVANMKDNGYQRIFDCGNLVFAKEYSR